MKDFDEVRASRPVKTVEERTFKLGGELFTVKQSVRPEALLPATRISRDSTAAQDLVAMDTLIADFLEGDGRERFLALRAREEDPIAFADLYEVMIWMVEVVSDRPTQEPASSGSGQGTTPPSLTDVSLPPPAAEAG